MEWGLHFNERRIDYVEQKEFYLLNLMKEIDKK